MDGIQLISPQVVDNLFAPLNFISNNFAEASGLEAGDQVKLLTCVLINYPIGLLFLYTKNVTFRLVLGTLFGVYLQFFLFGISAWVASFTVSLFYLLLQVVNREKYFPVLFLYGIGSISVTQIYRMIVDYGGWSLDVTLIQMILSLKMISFAYAYRDSCHVDSSLDERQRKYKLKELPGFLPYFAFMMYFPVSLMGPADEYKEFENYVYGREQYSNIPSPLMAMLKSFLVGAVFIGVYQFLSATFVLKFVLTDEFTNWPLFYRILYVIGYEFAFKFKFYACWFLLAGSVYASGLSYQKTGKEEGNFDRVQLVDVVKMETALDPRTGVNNWNKHIQDFLKHHIYTRDMQAQARAGQTPNSASATLKTFFFSGVWHGFYPSYFICFLFFFFALRITSNLYKLSRHFTWLQPSPLTIPVLYFINHMMGGFAFATFDLLFMNDILLFWKNIHYTIPIFIFGGYVLTSVFVPMLVPSRKKTKDEKKTQ